MMPRDKYIFIVQGVIGAYVLYKVSTTVYQHLKSKDRLKCNDHDSSLIRNNLYFSSVEITLQRQC